jgi:hypothetical protein
MNKNKDNKINFLLKRICEKAGIPYSEIIREINNKKKWTTQYVYPYTSTKSTTINE